MTSDDLEIIEIAPSRSGRVPDRSQQRRHRLAGLVLVALSIAAGVALSRKGSHDSRNPRRSQALPTTTSTTTAPGPLRTAATGSSRLTVSAPSGWEFGSPLALDGSLWVMTWRQRCPSRCSDVWWRIDPHSGTARKAPIPYSVDAERFTSGLGSIWALNYRLDDTPFVLRRLDPATGRVTVQAHLPGTGRLGNTSPPDHVVASDGNVWVETGGTLIRLDPTTLRETARVAVPRFNAMVVDHAVVWGVDSGDGGLWRVDPKTNTAHLVLQSCCFTQSIVADGRYVWFTHATQHGRMDLVRVSETPPYTAVSTNIPTAAVTASAGEVWFLGSETGTPSTSEPGLLARVDPTSLAVTPVAHLHVQTNPYIDTKLIIMDGAAWVEDANRTLTRVDG